MDAERDAQEEKKRERKRRRKGKKGGGSERVLDRSYPALTEFFFFSSRPKAAPPPKDPAVSLSLLLQRSCHSRPSNAAGQSHSHKVPLI